MDGLATTMDVLRVTVEGAVTSFRYPHLIQGVQPTYLMPPPATLHGHICSVLGETIAPESLRVGLYFTYRARFEDYEHAHFVGRAVKLSPLRRQLLFEPRLTLYLDRPDWLPYFRTPRYVVTLGRSQDLMRYSEVRVISVVREEHAYAASTLLSLEEATATLEGFTAQTMPQYINAARHVAWGAYARVEEAQEYRAPTWVDREAPTWHGLHRGIFWLGFTQ